MELKQNYSLANLNTFAVSAKAKYFYAPKDLAQIAADWDEIKRYNNRLVLGGGSNLLFVGDYDGLIINPQIFGVNVEREDEDHIWLKVGTAENWHNFVVNMTEQGYFGLENLALIPGTVGAAPVQNIGAYGVEVKSLIEAVECFDLDKGEQVIFANQDCQFGYRDSLFKQAGQGKYLVLTVRFKLSKKANLNLSYQPLKERFKTAKNITPVDVLKAVCEVRQEKLPDPKVLPNAGSFFKNPLVSKDQFIELKNQYPNIVGYEADKQVKLAAGWLIDNAGLKGYQQGLVATHKQQALVIVNRGEKKGEKIWRFAQFIQSKVKQKYNVILEPEVRVEGGNGY